ncbi:MAG: hypothetical protein JW699_02670 [Chitinispirillaceae bacterium]|nr:hypothetical protein [Chitinispirillaceae bacterium]
MNTTRRICFVFAAAGLMAAGAYGQEYPFSDDFSDAVQTGQEWGKLNLTDDSLAAVCSGGVYTVTNQHVSPSAAGIIYHNFTNKTATFTASSVITRSSADNQAGIVLCLSASPFNTYAVQLSGNDCIGRLAVTKYNSGSPSPMFNATYHHQDISDTITVSREGTVFTVFCNGVYLGSFTDSSPLAAGNVGFLVLGNSSAIFDDFMYTDQFTQGSFPAALIDNFNDGVIGKQWLLRDCPSFAEHDTVLDITPTGSNYVYAEHLMPIDTFYSKLIVSHRSGDFNALYGFYLRGPDSIVGMNVTWHTAVFGITGLGVWAAYVPGGTMTPNYEQGIVHGNADEISPGDTLFYQDTIVVTKTSGSSNYIMIINGNVADTLTTSDITFPVVGAGICVAGIQNIFADYFFIGPDSSGTGVINIAKKMRYVKGLKFSPMTSRYLFNPLGRVVGRSDASGRLTGRVLAPGFYFSDEKKSGVIISTQGR